MNIPALRSRIGNWDYYVTTLTFEHVAQHVQPVNDELHKSESLREVIQRSITSNYKSIRDYILHQPELFFNSLVLAVYDDYPDWREIEFRYGDDETYQMGVLEFPGQHKIFPVDGQHRVEGIKAALEERPDLAGQHISAVFIGHKNTTEGMQRTRRLFSTLNRYAKPVKLDDIIALDEDDCVAIVTRSLLEEYDLFTKNRVVYAKQKAIPNQNKEAITSIITLYQANLELFRRHYFEDNGKKIAGKKLTEYLKFRPNPEKLERYHAYCIEFWDAFKTRITAVADFLATDEQAADAFRNNETGGNLLFRPIGFLPFVKACITIRDRTGAEYATILENFNALELEINSMPWQFVAWDPNGKKMVMGSDTVVQLMLTYLYDTELLTESELKKLKLGYASKIAHQGDIGGVLDNLR